jgi:cytidylate kinase
MNITITGNLGSGKTSVCKELSAMGYEIISAGSIFRQIAEEKGISVIALNELAKTDRSIDDLIDQRTTRLGQEKDGVVFDSRLAWHFVPDSFKVFLMVDTQEAAKRVFEGEARASENSYTSVEDTQNGLTKRAALEKERFASLYDVNYYAQENYNLIIDSTHALPLQIAEEIVRSCKEYEEKTYEGVIKVSACSLCQNQKTIQNDGQFIRCKAEELPERDRYFFEFLSAEK